MQQTPPGPQGPTGHLLAWATGAFIVGVLVGSTVSLSGVSRECMASATLRLNGHVFECARVATDSRGLT